jgi:hypothetical protein
MTRWRAVLAGVTLAVLAESLVFLSTGRVTLVGGVAGSALAGYLGSDVVPDGAWHGLLAALGWGTVLIPATVVIALTSGVALPFPFEYVLPTVETPGEATTALLLGATLPNVVAGALGSAVRLQFATRRAETVPARGPE